MSRVLVILQFVFIALLAYPFTRPALNLLDVVLFLGGLLVFCMAILAMKWRTFTVMPEPKAGGELVTNGIYRVVRHPMYLAVLLCAVAASLAYMQWWKWLLLALLALVLIVKMRREEQLLEARYANYAAYRAKVKGIIPFLI